MKINGKIATKKDLKLVKRAMKKMDSLIPRAQKKCNHKINGKCAYRQVRGEMHEKCIKCGKISVSW